jgi:hypothetical protein
MTRARKAKTAIKETVVETFSLFEVQEMKASLLLFYSLRVQFRLSRFAHTFCKYFYFTYRSDGIMTEHGER